MHVKITYIDKRPPDTYEVTEETFSLMLQLMGSGSSNPLIFPILPAGQIRVPMRDVKSIEQADPDHDLTKLKP